MTRTILAVLSGFVAWMAAWFGGEKLFSAVWPQTFGAPQRAFEEALINGGPFTPETAYLLLQLTLGSIVSVMAGWLCALIAKGNARAPLILGSLLLAIGLLKATMSWSYVPMWYHVVFTGLLPVMTVVGGRRKNTT